MLALLANMCESAVFLEEEGEARKVMDDVARIAMDGKDAVCVSLIGERMVLQGVRFKEANLLSHGIVFARD
jgi:predicted RNA-binding protein